MKPQALVHFKHVEYHGPEILGEASWGQELTSAQGNLKQMVSSKRYKQGTGEKFFLFFSQAVQLFLEVFKPNLNR